MRVKFTLPQEAVPDENPHRKAEMPHLPRVGDLIGYSDLNYYLAVKSVVWEIQRNDQCDDLAYEPNCILDQHYVQDAS